MPLSRLNNWLAGSLDYTYHPWFMGEQNLASNLSSFGDTFGGGTFLSNIELAKRAGVDVTQTLKKNGITVEQSIRNRQIARLGHLGSDAELSTAMRSGSLSGVLKAMDASHFAFMKGSLIYGLAFGAIEGALDPNKPIIGTALKSAVGFGLWSTFFPTVMALPMITGTAAIVAGVTGNAARSSGQRLAHVMSGKGLYSQFDPSQNQFSGNIRRQSLGYIIQSRTNSRSFVGSESTYFHQQM
jgi:hypothetical protein